jgi:hypothetical protein
MEFVCLLIIAVCDKQIISLKSLNALGGHCSTVEEGRTLV